MPRSSLCSRRKATMEPESYIKGRLRIIPAPTNSTALKEVILEDALTQKAREKRGASTRDDRSLGHVKGCF